MGENSIDCQVVAERLPGFVVHALADDERAQVLQHLSLGCQRCQQELGELMEAACALAEGLAPIAPRREVKEALMQRIASEPQADADATCTDIDISAVTASPFPLAATSHAEVPNNLAAAPNRSAVAPNSSAVAPNSSAVAPNRHAVAPNRYAVAPNILAVAHGPLAVTPEHLDVAPNLAAVAPDFAAAAPNFSAAAPNFSAAAPNFSAAAPNYSAVARYSAAVAPNSSEIVAGRFGDPASARSRRHVFLPYVAATLGAMAAGSLVANFAQVSPQDLLARFAPLTPAMTPQWQVRIEKAEQAFGPPRAQLTKFGGNVAEQGFQAAIFYDGLAQQSHIFVFDAPPPAENQRLWLWFVDFRGNILSGGPLDYLGQHRAAGVFDIADVRQQLMEAVITSEPLGEHSAPSSPPLGRAHLRSSS